MSEKTGIEWCDATWNPVVGCEKISPGCKNCYAIRDAWRLGHNPNCKISTIYQDLVYKNEDGSLNWTGVVKCLPERLTIPLSWKKPLRIFVNSQSDLFHDDVPDQFIDRVFEMMAVCSWHTFIVVTKRAERMYQYLNYQLKDQRILTNVWIIVSVENQTEANHRIPYLLHSPAAVRGVSIEPLLGPVDLTNIEMSCFETYNALAGCGTDRKNPCQTIPNVFGNLLDWVILGGESGKEARPMNPDWVKSLRDQCVDHGTPFFFKQWGEWAIKYADGFLGDRFTFGGYGGLLYKIGKKQAGRLLDGVEWNQMPGESSR